MHYRNGREAKPGDKILHLPTGKSGILYDANPDVLTCNGRLAAISNADEYVTLSNCVHADDVAAAPGRRRPGGPDVRPVPRDDHDEGRPAIPPRRGSRFAVLTSTPH